jgi:hypothetical protein
MALSKSRILSYRQCPRKLYLETYHPELIHITPEQQKRFDVGREVGELARTFYPEGVLIQYDYEPFKSLDITKNHLSNSDITTLFEAAFSYNHALVRTDLLHKNKQGQLIIQEVKSATSVKDVYIEDCAIQVWVIEGAGYQVHDIELMYINNQFVYEQEWNYQGLFKQQSLLSEVNALKPHVEHWIKGALDVLDLEHEPAIQPGEQCKQPYDCPFIDYCAPVTTEYPVEYLPHGTRTAIALRNEGISDIRDIPEGRLTSENHQRIRRVTLTGNYELEPAAHDVMSELAYPRYYIDFETIQFAIPRWPGTKPYQQIPFQWSCHRENSAGELEHVEYLDTSGNDPSRRFIETLIDAVGKEGPILVYNAGFENTRLKELAERFSEYQNEIQSILGRIVDLLPIAKKYYYHPAMKGSWSIKRVLPTIAPALNYSELEQVQNGLAAQDAYLEAIDCTTDEQRKQEIRYHLIEYCKLDTYAMVAIAHFFEQGLSK